MYEQEEQKLHDAKRQLEGRTLPDARLDEAIMNGIQKAKSYEKKRHTYRAWMASAAAVLILAVFASSIRVSEDFASLVSGMPGMEKIVELVRYNKGLQSVVENDYVQKINQSDEHAGIEILLDSLIVDEEQMVLFYSFHADEQATLEGVTSTAFTLLTKSGERVPFNGLSFGGENIGESDNLSKLHRATIQMKEPLTEEEYVLEITLEKDTKEMDDTWSIPFTIDLDKVESTRSFAINQTFEIENQQITVKDVKISPTRVSVQVSYPEQNSKRIFDIEDLSLVDENGEVWSRISDGVTASGDFTDKTYYLQSNYFNEYETLSLQFNTLRALDKDELLVIVDPINKQILQAPNDNKLESVSYEEGWGVKFSWVEGVNHEKLVSPFNSYYDESGVERDISSFYNSEREFGFPWTVNDSLTPITLELQDYPSTIKGDVNIPLK